MVNKILIWVAIGTILVMVVWILFEKRNKKEVNNEINQTIEESKEVPK